MMSARLWRSSPRKTRVGSPATPSAWMAVRSSEVWGARGAAEVPMSSVVNMASCPPRSSGSLSCNVTTITAVISAMTFSASGAAPTPLYQEYQSHFGLTPFMVTIIFSAYVLCLLLALLTVGSLSDYIGRRPAILSALAINVVAMLIFMTAGSAGALVVARAVQGFATGFATTTSGPPCGDFARHHKSIVAIENSTVIYGLLACI